MASFTRKAIMASFVKLLEERPLSKVTVKDIVEDCGINRNTFYYHFEDIPSLIEAIVREETETVLQNHEAIESFEECLEIASGFILQHRKAALHIYNSSGRDIYQRYLMQMCRYVVESYINTKFTDFHPSEEDRDIILQLYSCQCFGLFIDWLEGGLKDDFPRRMDRLCHLRKGLIEETFRRSQEELTARNGGIA